MGTGFYKRGAAYVIGFRVVCCDSWKKILSNEKQLNPKEVNQNFPEFHNCLHLKLEYLFFDICILGCFVYNFIPDFDKNDIKNKLDNKCKASIKCEECAYAKIVLTYAFSGIFEIDKNFLSQNYPNHQDGRKRNDEKYFQQILIEFLVLKQPACFVYVIIAAQK